MDLVQKTERGLGKETSSGRLLWPADLELRACERWAFRAPGAWHPHRFSRSAISYKPQQARLLAKRRLHRKHHGWVLWVSEDSRVSGGCCEGSSRTPRSGGWQSAVGGYVGLYRSKQGASWQEGQQGATQGWVAGVEGILSSHPRVGGGTLQEGWYRCAYAWESGGASITQWPRKPCGAAGHHPVPDFQAFSFPPPLALPGSTVSPKKRDWARQMGQMGHLPKVIAVVD